VTLISPRTFENNSVGGVRGAKYFRVVIPR
jgi:hypothetical protein